MLTPEWRKSSYSNSNSNCVEVKGVWRTSSPSNASSTCVEVHPGAPGAPDAVAVRDSKHPAGPHLSVTPAAWSTFTASIKHGSFGV